MPSDREDFYAEYVSAIEDGSAAVFAGAGLSKPGGYVDWKGLLRGVATDLGLNLDVEDDLVAVAEYHLNASNRNRSRLNQLVLDEFGDTAEATESHKSLARLPIKTFWTSNYDAMLETTLRAEGRRVEVKASDSTFGVSKKRRDATVYKMHGDANDPAKVILTRDDYDLYAREHGAMRARLHSDLLDKTFLFLGFSFTDPNMNLVLGEIRASLKDNPRTHFAIFRREPGEYERTRQRHRLGDLQRYGIRSVLVDRYEELPEVLAELERRYRRRWVLVSGAAHDPSPLGAEGLGRLSALLGAMLIDAGYNIVSGFGQGVGSPLIGAAAEAIFRTSEPSLDRRLHLFPFPQTAPDALSLQEFRREYRERFIAGSGFAIFVAGNRPVAAGGVEMSPGVFEECEIALTKRLFPIPIGASGWAAEQIWNDVANRFEEIYPKGTDRALFTRLNDRSASPDQIADAVLDLIHSLTPKARKR